MSSPQSLGLDLDSHHHDTSGSSSSSSTIRGIQVQNTHSMAAAGTQSPSPAAMDASDIRAQYPPYMAATDSRRHSPVVMGDIRAQYYPFTTVSNPQSLSSAAVGNALAGYTPSMAVADYQAMPMPYDATSQVGDDDFGNPHSDSVVLMSEEENLHEAFTNAYRNAFRLGFHASLFFPQNAAEFAEVRTETIEMRNKRLNEKIRQDRKEAQYPQKARAARQRRERLAAHSMLLEEPRIFDKLVGLPLPPGAVKPVFHGKPGVGHDGLSTVLTLDNCPAFSSHSPGDEMLQVDDWPSIASFRMYKGTNTLPPPQSWFHHY